MQSQYPPQNYSYGGCWTSILAPIAHSGPPTFLQPQPFHYSPNPTPTPYGNERQQSQQVESFNQRSISGTKFTIALRIRCYGLRIPRSRHVLPQTSINASVDNIAASYTRRLPTWSNAQRAPALKLSRREGDWWISARRLGIRML